METFYSLETMDKRILCRTFNYYSIGNPFKRQLTRVKRRMQGRKDFYTLGDIYRMYCDGNNIQDILRDHPKLSLDAILIGRAFFAYKHPIRFKNRKLAPLRVMFDENIGVKHTIEGGMQVFGYATHVSFEGMVGAKDARLWGFLRARNIDILVTKDKAVNIGRNTKDTLDITRCAQLSWGRALKNNGGVVDKTIRQMPLILHVPHNASVTEIKNLLRKHQHTIREMFDERVSPVISVTKGKAKHGIHFFEIMSDGFKKKSDGLRDQRLDAILTRFDISAISMLEEGKLRARMKRCIEHEISQELKYRHDGRDKIIHLKEMEDSFNPLTYNYYEGNEVIANLIAAAIHYERARKPAWERYGRRNPALV